VFIAVDVAEAVNRDPDQADPEFLKILELQTTQLERRVRACQARIMLVTCFDSRVWLADQVLTWRTVFVPLTWTEVHFLFITNVP